MIENLSEAITVAEKAPSGEGLQPSVQKEMEKFVRKFRPADLTDMSDGRLDNDIIRLSRLLNKLGMRDNAQSLIQATLRHMELIEAGSPVFPPSAWNRIAVQLALHGELNEARLVLMHALSRARDDTTQAVVILTNLSVISLGSNNTEFAERWAERARDALREAPDHPEAERLRITLASLQVSTMKDLGDMTRLEEAVQELTVSTARLLAERGEGQTEVLEALATLADAKLTLAQSAGSLEGMHVALRALERVAQLTMALHGERSPLALAAHANLPWARIELAQSAGLKNTDAHIESAVEALDSVVELTFAALGQEHPQSTAIVDNLTMLRSGLAAGARRRESFTHFYNPRDNERRNFAKSDAMYRETDRIRIIAFGGASYFMEPLDRYKPIIEDRLSKGVTIEMIISSPWNSAAAFHLVNDASRMGTIRWNTPEQALRLIEDGDYTQTFTPVLDSYRRLRATHGDHVALRVYHSVTPATSLLTSDVCFFEPYASPDTKLRTRRPLKTFEVEYGRASHFYEMDDSEFEKFWNVSLTVEQYEAWEGELKALHRRLLEILSAAKSGTSM